LKGNAPSNESARRKQLEVAKAREAREKRSTYLSSSQAIVPAYAATKR